MEEKVRLGYENYFSGIIKSVGITLLFNIALGVAFYYVFNNKYIAFGGSYLSTVLVAYLWSICFGKDEGGDKVELFGMFWLLAIMYVLFFMLLPHALIRPFIS